MQFSDEELISFLLGDAPRSLVDGIKEHLDRDVALVDRLGYLRMVLGQMDAINTNYEPPADLIDKTLARLDAEPSQDADLYQEDAYDHNHKRPALDPQVAAQNALRPASDPPRQRRNLWDSAALTLSLSLLCCLALPALVGARFEARKAQCAQNLRRTGIGLIDFSSLAPDARFPSIATSGPTAFAGVYAIHLNAAGLLESIQQLRCPSLPWVNIPFVQHPSGRVSTGEVFSGNGSHVPFASQGGFFPTLEQLCDLPPEQLRVWRVHAGGDYAYNLGVLEDARPVAPRNSSRSYFAILCDNPVLNTPVADGSLTDGPWLNEPIERFEAHDGRGINILYEDGRVQFLSVAYLQSLACDSGSQVSLNSGLNSSVEIRATPPFDHPLRNTHGQHQVGLNPQDASLAPSYFTPLGL